MALFSWTPALATGHPFMDDDHRVLVDRINSVLETLSEGASNMVVSTALSELLGYTREHFQREEVQMLRIAYPLVDAHIADHAHLLQQVDELRTQLDAGQAIDAMALYNFLTRWAKDHIVLVDMKLAAALNAVALTV